jgi:hypothetical protein
MKSRLSITISDEKAGIKLFDLIQKSAWLHEMIQNEYQGLGFPSDGVIKTGNKD